ncbi:MAG: glycoside hydrolase family 108 protein [Thermodesulfobacteriota bacterium]
MANFNEAFIKTAAHEGGYVNDPDDAGGETYKGVARRYNPSWSGWEIIDIIKQETESSSELKKSLEQNEQLQSEVRLFYKQFYWDRFWGDEVPVQEIAEELFDTGVNMGVRKAVSFLQESLNLLNRNQKSYADIGEDGLFGPTTLRTLETYCKNDKPSSLLTVMNILQGMHYIERMRKNPVQEKYARGWLKRVKISK